MAPPRKGDLSEVEQKLIDAVTKGNIEDVKILLKENNVKIDFLDESGMTLLQHAAFRGKTALCEMFLARGADVNSNFHENGYTTLMFAALSGNTEVTRMMLTAGAKIDHVNSVGRTAAQMAGFVGQHQCVSVINSFFPKEKLLHFTKPQGLEKEAKLTTETANAMLKMMNTANLHPVKLSYILQDNVCLLENSLNVIRVLELLCEKYMKARDTNDVMAMKTHYFSVLIKHASKVYKDKESLDPWIKSLLKQREDGCEENQEKLIRQSLREFPYGDSQLFQQMVGNLAKVKIGNDPTGLSILSQGINGQKFTFDVETPCGTCGESKAEKKCSACKMVNYCNARCQKLHWSVHKKRCKSLAEEYRIEQEKKKIEEERQRKEREKKEQEQIQKKLEATNLQNDEVTQRIIAALKDKKMKEEKLKNISNVSLDNTTPKEMAHKDVEKINVMSSEKVIVDTEVKREKPKIAEKPKIVIDKNRSSEQGAPKVYDRPKLMTEKPKLAAKPKMPWNKPKLAEKPKVPANKPKLLAEKSRSNKLKLSIGKTKPQGVKSPEKVKSPPIQIKPILKKTLPKQEKVVEIPDDLSYEIRDRPMQRLPPDGIENEECQQNIKAKLDSREVGHLQESRMLTKQAPVTTDEAEDLIENTITPRHPEKLKEVKSVEAEPDIKTKENDETKNEAKKSEDVEASVKSDAEDGKPLFVSSLTDQEVEEGQELKFEVVYSGIPAPSVVWYLDDEEIKQNPEVRIVTKGGLSMLLIRECIPEDEGEYTVEVTNKNGCVSASAFVAVLDGPILEVEDVMDIPVEALNLNDIVHPNTKIESKAEKTLSVNSLADLKKLTDIMKNHVIKGNRLSDVDFDLNTAEDESLYAELIHEMSFETAEESRYSQLDLMASEFKESSSENSLQLFDEELTSSKEESFLELLRYSVQDRGYNQEESLQRNRLSQEALLQCQLKCIASGESTDKVPLSQEEVLQVGLLQEEQSQQNDLSQDELEGLLNTECLDETSQEEAFLEESIQKDLLHQISLQNNLFCLECVSKEGSPQKDSWQNDKTLESALNTISLQEELSQMEGIVHDVTQDESKQNEPLKLSSLVWAYIQEKMLHHSESANFVSHNSVNEGLLHKLFEQEQLQNRLVQEHLSPHDELYQHDVLLQEESIKAEINKESLRERLLHTDTLSQEELVDEEFSHISLPEELPQVTDSLEVKSLHQQKLLQEESLHKISQLNEISQLENLSQEESEQYSQQYWLSKEKSDQETLCHTESLQEEPLAIALAHGDSVDNGFLFTNTLQDGESQQVTVLQEGRLKEEAQNELFLQEKFPEKDTFMPQGALQEGSLQSEQNVVQGEPIPIKEVPLQSTLTQEYQTYNGCLHEVSLVGDFLQLNALPEKGLLQELSSDMENLHKELSQAGSVEMEILHDEEVQANQSLTQEFHVTGKEILINPSMQKEQLQQHKRLQNRMGQESSSQTLPQRNMLQEDSLSQEDSLQEESLHNGSLHGVSEQSTLTQKDPCDSGCLLVQVKSQHVASLHGEHVQESFNKLAQDSFHKSSMKEISSQLGTLSQEGLLLSESLKGKISEDNLSQEGWLHNESLQEKIYEGALSQEGESLQEKISEDDLLHGQSLKEKISEDALSQEGLLHGESLKEKISEDDLSQEGLLHSESLQQKISEDNLSQEGLLHSESLQEKIPEDDLSQEGMLHSESLQEKISEDDLSQEGLLHSESLQEKVSEEALSQEGLLYGESLQETISQDDLSQEGLLHSESLQEKVSEEALSQEGLLHGESLQEKILETALLQEGLLHSESLQEKISEHDLSKERLLHSESLHENISETAFSQEALLHSESREEKINEDDLSQEEWLHSESLEEEILEDDLSQKGLLHSKPLQESIPEDTLSQEGLLLIESLSEKISEDDSPQEELLHSESLKEKISEDDSSQKELLYSESLQEKISVDALSQEGLLHNESLLKNVQRDGLSCVFSSQIDLPDKLLQQEKLYVGTEQEVPSNNLHEKEERTCSALCEGPSKDSCGKRLLQYDCEENPLLFFEEFQNELVEKESLNDVEENVLFHRSVNEIKHTQELVIENLQNEIAISRSDLEKEAAQTVLLSKDSVDQGFEQNESTVSQRVDDKLCETHIHHAPAEMEKEPSKGENGEENEVESTPSVFINKLDSAESSTVKWEVPNESVNFEIHSIALTTKDVKSPCDKQIMVVCEEIGSAVEERLLHPHNVDDTTHGKFEDLGNNDVCNEEISTFTIEQDIVEVNKGQNEESMYVTHSTLHTCDTSIKIGDDFQNFQKQENTCLQLHEPHSLKNIDNDVEKEYWAQSKKLEIKHTDGTKGNYKNNTKGNLPECSEDLPQTITNLNGECAVEISGVVEENERLNLHHNGNVDLEVGIAVTENANVVSFKDSSKNITEFDGHIETADDTCCTEVELEEIPFIVESSMHDSCDTRDQVLDNKEDKLTTKEQPDVNIDSMYGDFIVKNNVDEKLQEVACVINNETEICKTTGDTVCNSDVGIQLENGGMELETSGWEQTMLEAITNLETLSVDGSLAAACSECNDNTHDKKDVIPLTISHLCDLSVDEGTRAELEVTFTGFPEPKVTWYLEDEEIDPCGDIEIITENGRSTLVIDETIPDDEGEYCVEVANDFESVTSTAFLCVLVEDFQEELDGSREVTPVGGISDCDPYVSGEGTVTPTSESASESSFDYFDEDNYDIYSDEDENYFAGETQRLSASSYDQEDTLHNTVTLVEDISDDDFLDVFTDHDALNLDNVENKNQDELDADELLNIFSEQELLVETPSELSYDTTCNRRQEIYDDLVYQETRSWNSVINEIKAHESVRSSLIEDSDESSFSIEVEECSCRLLPPCYINLDNEAEEKCSVSGCVTDAAEMATYTADVIKLPKDPVVLSESVSNIPRNISQEIMASEMQHLTVKETTDSENVEIQTDDAELQRERTCALNNTVISTKNLSKSDANYSLTMEIPVAIELLPSSSEEDVIDDDITSDEDKELYCNEKTDVCHTENERKKKRKHKRDPTCSAGSYKHNMVSSPIEPIAEEDDLWTRESEDLEERMFDTALEVESKILDEESKSDWKNGKKDIGALILSRFESITEEPKREEVLDKDVIQDVDNLETTSLSSSYDAPVVPNLTDSMKDHLNKDENKAMTETDMRKEERSILVIEQDQCIPSGEAVQQGNTVDQPSAKVSDILDTGVQNDVKQSSDTVKELPIISGQGVLESEVPVVVIDISSAVKQVQYPEKSFEKELEKPCVVDEDSEKQYFSNVCKDDLPEPEQKVVYDDAQSVMVVKDLPVVEQKEMSSVEDTPLGTIVESKTSQKEILKEPPEDELPETFKDAPQVKGELLSTNVPIDESKTLELKAPSKEAARVENPSNLIKSKWQEIEKKVIKSKSQDLKKTVPQKPRKDIKDEVVKKAPVRDVKDASLTIKDTPKESDKKLPQLGIKNELSKNVKDAQEEKAQPQKGVKDVTLKSLKDATKGIEKKMSSKNGKNETEESLKKVFPKNTVSKENGKKSPPRGTKDSLEQSLKKTPSKDVPKEFEKKPAPKKIAEETEKKPLPKSARDVSTKVSKDVVVKLPKDTSKDSEKKTSPKSFRDSFPKQSKNVSELEKKSPPKDHNGVKGVKDVSAKQENRVSNSSEKTSQGLLSKRFPQGLSTKKAQEPEDSPQASHKDLKKDVSKKPIPGILAKKFPLGLASKASKETHEPVSKSQAEEKKQEKVERTSPGLFSKQSSTVSVTKKMDEPKGKVDKKVPQGVTNKTTERSEEAKQPAEKRNGTNSNGTNSKLKDVPNQQQKSKQEAATKKPLALDKKPSPTEAKDTVPGKKKLPGILANKFPFLEQKSQDTDKKVTPKRTATAQEPVKKKSDKSEISESAKTVKDIFPTVVQKASQLLKEKQQKFEKDTVPQTVEKTKSTNEQLGSLKKDKSEQKLGEGLNGVHKDTGVTDVPLTVSPLSDIKAKKGSSVKFEVTFAGVPTPTVTWFLDGDIITNMDGIKITTKNGMSSVMIEDCISDDEGDYCVEIENKNGKVSTTAFLGIA